MGKNSVVTVDLCGMTDDALAEYVPEYSRNSLLRGVRDMTERYLFKANKSMSDENFRGIIEDFFFENGNSKYQLYVCEIAEKQGLAAYIAIASTSDGPINLSFERRKQYAR